MKAKKNVGIALLILFSLTLVSGILIYLKFFGIVVQPRSVLKVIHWVLGYGMAVLFLIHWKQFKAVLSALKAQKVFFYVNTCLLVFFCLAAILTGAMKLLLPVKIPYLGLYHFYFGVGMAVTGIIHLFRGIPALRRNIRVGK